MADIHIEEFYHDVGKVLLNLHQRFPLQSTLYVEDISGPDQVDEYGLHCDRFNRGFSAILWLKQQGLIHFSGSIRQEAVENACLTQKCFVLLHSPSKNAEKSGKSLPPSVANDLISNISTLRKALKSGSSIAISNIVFELLESTL